MNEPRHPHGICGEHELRLILESTAEGIYGVDAEGRITFVNPSAAAILGYAPEMLIGQDAHALFHHSRKDGSPYPAEACPAHQVRAGGPAVQIGDEVFWHASGRPIPVRYAVRPIIEAGRQLGAVVSFTDISDQLAFEQQLVSSRHAAEAANVAKSAFIANMSHEIRTPLNAIIGLSHLVLQDNADPRQGARLQKIVDASQHLLGLINDILDLSKIEAGRLQLEYIDFNLARTLEIVGNHVEEAVHAKGLHWRIHIDPRLPAQLKGDPLRVGQVLLNFASNAVKFTEHGQITLSARLIDRLQRSVRIRFEVADTGIGFSPEVGERLFHAFEQADASTTRVHGGTGLGLAICRRIADMMHGEVGANSVPGQGSIFWFEVELHCPLDRPAPSPLPSLAGSRALVIGPAGRDHESIIDFLRQNNVRAYGLQSPMQAAIRVLMAVRNAQPYDFVFFHGAGEAFVELSVDRALRDLRAPDLARIPTLVALSDPLTARRIDAAAFDAVLDIPSSAQWLKDNLLAVLAARSAEAEPAAPAPVDAPGEALPRLPPAHVLLVEDNPINQEVAADILQTLGLSCDIADNGAAALAQLRTRHYDLVLMDMQMPVMDGLEATRQLRQLPGLAQLPVLAMTANAFAEDREQCFAAGMNDHIAKPVTPPQLYRILAKWLRPLPASTTDTAPAAAPAPAEVPDEPPDLDLAFGLRAVPLGLARYIQFLQKLLATHGDDVAAIRTTLRQGDHEAARRQAHTLKGAAATLGAVAVSQAAFRVEQSIREQAPTDRIDAQLDTLGERLARLSTRCEALVRDGR